MSTYLTTFQAKVLNTQNANLYSSVRMRSQGKEHFVTIGLAWSLWQLCPHILTQLNELIII